MYTKTIPLVEDYGKNIDFVTQQLLCTGCATCDAVCPEDAIYMTYYPRSGVFEPRIDTARCTLCGLCVAVCPGFRLDISRWPPQPRADKRHNLIGPYQSIWRAYSSNEYIRVGAASGGAVTEIIRHLFKSNRIDGAIVTRMNPTFPLEGEAVIVESEKEILAAQKSKYCPHPHNSILKTLLWGKLQQKRFAFVGLPSHVHGLRNLQLLFPRMNQTIPFVLSLFTAHVPSREATEFLLSLNGVEPDDVEFIEYRGDGIPGRLRIKCRDGKEIFIPHQHWSYWGHTFSYFFYPPRDWLYFDKLSQWADWSVGDNWQQFRTDHKGASTVVCRSIEAEAIIKEMFASGALITQPMTDFELVHDQDLENKLNIGIRLKVWQLLGGKVPKYHPPLPVRWRDVGKTFRFALYVRLCMLKPPTWMLASVIKVDFLVRKRLLHLIKTLARKIRRLLRMGLAFFKALRILPALNAASSVPPKILMIGGYGWKDIGDESMPHADRLKLKRCLPNDTCIVMASADPCDTMVRHGEQSISDLQELVNVGAGPAQILKWSALAGLFLLGTILQKIGWRLAMWPQARTFLDELADSCLLFNVGGGNLNSLTRGELYKKSITYTAASILGIPMVLSGQTIGPFSRRSDRFLAKFALNRVRMITFRDKHESQATTKALGVRKPILMDAADDAITLPAIPYTQARTLLREETGIDFDNNPPNLLILLNCKASLSIFKHAGQTNDLEAETQVLLQLAERLLAQDGVTVVLMSTDFTNLVDDRVVHREVHRRLTDSRKAFVLEREYTDLELKGMIAQADLALGMRYHFHVFAASEGIPFLGFASGEYQMRKLRGLANLLSEPDCYFGQDVEHADFECLWQAVERVMTERISIAERLNARVHALKQASHQSINLACSIVEESAAQ